MSSEISRIDLFAAFALLGILCHNAVPGNAINPTREEEVQTAAKYALALDAALGGELEPNDNK